MSIQLPQYKSHKTVRAAKITGFRENGNPLMPTLLLGELQATVDLLPDWHAKHKPQVGGYYVVYDDGYASFSPAKAFEEGYAPIPTDHRDRVRIEKAELDTKLGALHGFFGSKTFEGLSGAEQARLRDQHSAMLDYSAILGERIEAFAPPVEVLQHTEDPGHAPA